MHALTDDEQVARLEKKVDDGFAEMRTEFRAFRAEIGALHRLLIQLFCSLGLAILLGFAGIIIAMLTHHV